jgi:hypothetical protein
MKTAHATIKGIEVMRMIGRGQFRLWVEAVGGHAPAVWLHRGPLAPGVLA